MRALSVVSRSPEETRIVGASLAPVLLPGDVISLSGDLGAGKTVFVQGLATALGVQRRVTSPTFVIVHEYEGRFPILHLDVYRLDSFQEVLDLGFEELLDPEAILLV
ncbi:MAG: tRNA threonylcarbamoyladenosine biosynthesis protein TsaE, partial [Actinomycetota bacterium]|nr:tRNA threonylcarbamoyladenosine biosynthesis protein TsaE [Actinomycetota bacterium]